MLFCHFFQIAENTNISYELQILLNLFLPGYSYVRQKVMLITIRMSFYSLRGRHKKPVTVKCKGS